MNREDYLEMNNQNKIYIFITFYKFYATVDFVTETKGDQDDVIERKMITQDFNRFDGMGLISPRQSKRWARELGLDYIPAQWCIRQSFMKGMLCTFDIHDFCEKKNGGNYIIKSIYGDEVDLRDIDVIVSESQFKLWDSFDSLETYKDNCEENELYWGVTLYTPKQDKDILKMNYQFLQTLNLNDGDIKEVCSQFVNWIEGVTGEDLYYTLLFLMGVNNTEESIKRYFEHGENYWVKCLAVCPELINDKYIRKKIFDMVKKKISDACLGSIIVDGNFQVIVSDPYAMMEHVCGLEVNGLLGARQYYSEYWNRKGTDLISSMRAPLTGRSEHLKLPLVKNEELDYWYRYCYTGIILNVHGSETCAYAGSDFDYDILATTSNKQIINGVYDDEVVVVYNPPKSEKKIINDVDLYKSDLFAFGSIIGQITNKSTIIYCLLERFKAGSAEYSILMNRLKMCTKLQNAQIDKSKLGKEVKGIPDHWTRADNVGGNEEFYNSILLDKHPYFFRYLYKDTDRQYKNYVKNFNRKVKNRIGMQIEEMIKKNKYTKKEREVIDNFYKYMPVFCDNSVMNNICRYIESINFDLKEKIKTTESNNIHVLLMKDVNIDDKIYKKIVKTYKSIKNIRATDWNTEMSNTKENSNQDDGFFEFLDNTKEVIRNKFLNVTSKIYDIVDCLVYMMYVDKECANKYLLWDVFGDILFENLKSKYNNKVKIPFECDNGDINYLGKQYTIREVDLCESE